MGYFDAQVTRIFPEATHISEDWDACTVSFHLENPTGPLDLEITVELIRQIHQAFGTRGVQIHIMPDNRYNEPDYNNAVGVILKVTMSQVVFPPRPK